MIDSTLREWISILILEAMILAVAGYLNCYIPKNQIQKIERHSRKEQKHICVIEPKVRIDRSWYLILAIVASVSSAIYFVLQCTRDVEDTFEVYGSFAGILYIVIATTILLVMTIIFVVAPFVAEKKSIEGKKEELSAKYGITIDIEEV